MALKRVKSIISSDPASANEKTEGALERFLIPEEQISVAPPQKISKNKGGRPKSKNKRCRQVKLSLDDQSMILLQNIKRETGKNASELFIDFLVGTKIKPAKIVTKEELDAYRSLAEQTRRLGISINQFIRLTNVKNISLTEQLQNTYEHIIKELNRFKHNYD